MFNAASTRLPRVGGRALKWGSSLQGFSGTSSTRRAGRTAALAVVGTATLIGVAYSYNTARVVHNDSSAVLDDKSTGTVWPTLSDEHLETLVWGSNKSSVLSPGHPKDEAIRSPSSVEWLQDVALRDLVLHEHHGACVDARGDVYQWGDGFYNKDGVEGKDDHRLPELSLSGKDIVSLQLTANTLIALSSTGKIYVKPADGTPDSKETSSWSSWLFGGSEDGNFVELRTDSKLSRNEKFISISAGNDHLLALTSQGRTFALPLSEKANEYGQLGVRKVDIPAEDSPSSSSASARKQVDLVPKSVANPYSGTTAYARSADPVNASAIRLNLEEEKERRKNRVYCDTLFEIPSLKGIKIAQAVAGARSSYVRTESEGRVLAWGANQHGQLGLGPTVTIDTITIPTEVVFSRSAPAGTRSQCIDICTGGDLTFFLVERRDGSFMPTTDVLACGMGQWGGLGAGVFTTAQSTPMRVKAVSGLMEFSEKTQNLQAIAPYALSASPTGHVLLTLDTLERSGPPGGGGRDLFAWGKNHDYQLGNGKRTSLATPITLDIASNPTSDTRKLISESKMVVPGGRVMLMTRKADVKDLQGKLWRKKVEVEQRAVAGYSSSLVYWRICGY